MSRVSDELAIPLEQAGELPEIGLLADLLALTKARLSLLVIVTTFVGFCLASGPALDWLRLLHAVLGTTLAACAAAVLNQFLEAEVDRLMERTRHRPLPGGRMKPGTALVLGSVLAVVGVTWLWFAANPLSACLAAATIVIYIAFYTPLKRRTSLCTIVGAISGAIPPVIGWTAAQPSLEFGAWILFGVLFTWQMPHFLAIAWIYRDEYAQAGFVMLKQDDLSGSATAMQSLLYTLALAAITIAPFAAGLNNAVYLSGALVLDVAFIFFAVQFFIHRTRPTARCLFFASIFYLPLLLGLMIFTQP